MSQGYDEFFKQVKKAREEEDGGARVTFQISRDGVEAQTTREPRATSTPAQKLRQKIKTRAPRQKSKFPWAGLVLTAAVSAGLGWWSVDPTVPERLLHRIDVQFMGKADAETAKTPEKSAATKESSKEKAAASTAGAVNSETAQPAEALPEELSHLEKLRDRSRSLDQREKELNQLEEELQRQKDEIEARIKQLEDLRAQITNVLKERVEVDQEKVMKLVDTYSNMKPKQAAEVMAGIDEDLAVEVLGKMKKKNAAEIMNLLEPGKARSISEKYAGFKRR